MLISEIGEKLDKLAPAQLGFKADNSLSAYKSNLRRALGLAGLTVMPGRHVTQLSAEWPALLDSLPKSLSGTASWTIRSDSTQPVRAYCLAAGVGAE